jgi:hypothetical protein
MIIACVLPDTSIIATIVISNLIHVRYVIYSWVSSAMPMNIAENVTVETVIIRYY